MSAFSDIAENAAGAAVPNGAAEAEAPTSLTKVVRWKVPVLTPPPAVAPARNPSLPTFVGLIILILTFFIVLTSISIRDTSKSDAAVASVQQAFSGNAVTDEVKAQNPEEAARAYIAGLTDRIQSLVPLMGGKPGPASDHQVLWLPIGLAFAGDAVRVEAVFPKILGEVVRSLPSIPRRFAPRVEMRLCATDVSDRVRDRAVAIAAALAAQKAPLNQFSVGIAPCDPARIGIAIALAPADLEATP
jgi:hypothetical protein